MGTNILVRLMLADIIVDTPQGPKTIDAHCHLSDPRLDPPTRQAIIERAIAAGVTHFVLGGVDPEDWQRQKELAQQAPGRFSPVFGFHPWWVAQSSPSSLPDCLALLEREFLSSPSPSHPVAIGETGLDYQASFNKESRPLQIEFFEAQLRLAQKIRVPVVLHVVRAHKEAITILKMLPPPCGGLLHGFSGDFKTACRYLELGMSLSINSRIADSHSSSLKLREVLKSIPSESVVLESDAPDQPPRAFSGKWNEPQSLLLSAQILADLKGVPLDTVLEQNREKIRKIFSIARSGGPEPSWA